VIDDHLSRIIREFLEEVFSWSEGSALPPFEDIFTMIDLSANTGHHLGSKYSPARLRAMRRFLIYRLFHTLNARFSDSSAAINGMIDHLVVGKQCQFVVLNWDIVLERYLGERHIGYDYLPPLQPWLDASHGPGLGIVKVHGSANWVYCGNCRTAFYADSKLALNIRVDIRASDLALFEVHEPERLQIDSEFRECRRCQCPDSVGSHIATFSYRKSFRTQVFQAAWREAERVLTAAPRWIFVGYSLPEADYEFKHLLKLAQLTHRDRQKRITSVLLDDTAAACRYHALFGPDIEICQGGLGAFVRQQNGAGAGRS
jgi:hypothetical protein